MIESTSIEKPAKDETNDDRVDMSQNHIRERFVDDRERKTCEQAQDELELINRETHTISNWFQNGVDFRQFVIQELHLLLSPPFSLSLSLLLLEAKKKWNGKEQKRREETQKKNRFEKKKLTNQQQPRHGSGIRIFMGSLLDLFRFFFLLLSLTPNFA